MSVSEPFKRQYPDLGWCWVCPCGRCLGRDRRRPAVYTCPDGHRWRRLYAEWTKLKTVRMVR